MIFDDQKVHHDSVLNFDVLDQRNMKMSSMGFVDSSEIVPLPSNLTYDDQFQIRSNCSLTRIEADVIEYSAPAS